MPISATPRSPPLPFKYPWLFILDADERALPELVAEMPRSAITQPPRRPSPASACGAAKIFYGASGSSTPSSRRSTSGSSAHGHVRYTRLRSTNAPRSTRRRHRPLSASSITFHFPRELPTGSTSTTHTPRSKPSCSPPDSRHAARILTSTALFGASFDEKRVAQKAIFYKMPLRPALKWAYMMLIRGASSRWTGRHNLRHAPGR